MNPAAKKDPASPIYGMPVFNVEQSRSILVLKRSMNAGFSGVENELFFLPNTMMVLGDAKKTLIALANAVKGEGAAGALSFGDFDAGQVAGDECFPFQDDGVRSRGGGSRGGHRARGGAVRGA